MSEAEEGLGARHLEDHDVTVVVQKEDRGVARVFVHVRLGRQVELDVLSHFDDDVEVGPAIRRRGRGLCLRGGRILVHLVDLDEHRLVRVALVLAQARGVSLGEPLERWGGEEGTGKSSPSRVRCV